MKFLCYVHISFKIVYHLRSLGYETLHVNFILAGSNTNDSEIAAYADLNDYIIISKDFDFINSHFIQDTPKKLIKINLGNISNQKLIEIINDNIDDIVNLARKRKFIVEIGKDSVLYI